ncbi:RimK domain protein ATP-grasp [Magnetococcus marinus MC-1]|uniref:RimK domain protein ATP-grasp n=1 Tax=Magnetococcus marinus (strain ATCC BAA-1437 / JCM 17883 / MC-1) TaxID=156889 RepID=A0L8V7_MAGMM|nr:RimK family alpha-L-glutamate ligase [Magnetococcus marinus]ABK44400.1 RimK domain protein ATP-grasp [Magnetococcus marinus MC-1]
MAARYTIVVDSKTDWFGSTTDFDVVTVAEYLARGESKNRRVGANRVVNLCRHTHIMSGGYYCSLLAEARGDIVLPSMADILDLSHKSLYAFLLPELNDALAKAHAKLTEQAVPFQFLVAFGQTEEPALALLGRQLFDVFRYPIVRVQVVEKSPQQWKITSLKPLGPHQVAKTSRLFVEESLRGFARLPLRRKPCRTAPLYDLAILVNPNEELPPSDAPALAQFVKAGQALRMRVDMITSKDIHRIPEFDALFLRETTSISDHTFHFARKAEQEGLPVIDDTGSIIRCTNKVYLYELLSANGIPVPNTRVVDRQSFTPEIAQELMDVLGTPIILKIPDGSFSRGMTRAENLDSLMEGAKSLFAHSRLILAQTFMYTSFDWRIGVLRGLPLFANQYMMSRNHWQIYHHHPDGGVENGGFRALPLTAVPAEVVETARRAASLIGNGLYGVDLKQTPNGVFVIEVNDNPNIDHGVEDKILKGSLYTTILKEFIARIEASGARPAGS